MDGFINGIAQEQLKHEEATSIHDNFTESEASESWNVVSNIGTYSEEDEGGKTTRNENSTSKQRRTQGVFARAF